MEFSGNHHQTKFEPDQLLMFKAIPALTAVHKTAVIYLDNINLTLLIYRSIRLFYVNSFIITSNSSDQLKSEPVSESNRILLSTDLVTVR